MRHCSRPLARFFASFAHASAALRHGVFGRKPQTKARRARRSDLPPPSGNELRYMLAAKEWVETGEDIEALAAISIIKTGPHVR